MDLILQGAASAVFRNEYVLYAGWTNSWDTIRNDIHILRLNPPYTESRAGRKRKQERPQIICKTMIQGQCVVGTEETDICRFIRLRPCDGPTYPAMETPRLPHTGNMFLEPLHCALSFVERANGRPVM